jgi:hypothetical protein
MIFDCFVKYKRCGESYQRAATCGNYFGVRITGLIRSDAIFEPQIEVVFTVLTTKHLTHNFPHIPEL